MQDKTHQINQEYKNNAEAIIQNLQQAVEDSFNRIDAQLDQLLNDKFNLILPSQLSSDLPKVNSNTLLKFQNDVFQIQINQEVTSLIKSNIHNEIQKKEQNYQNQYKKNQIQWEHKIKDKDYQIQQLINQQTIQRQLRHISTKSNLKPFTYQLIQQNTIKQDEWCYAIAVNQYCSILIAG